MTGHPATSGAACRSRVTAGTIFFLGVAVALAGVIAFSYAREHEPRPGADPMAVHLISRAAFRRLHDGGIAAMAAGAFFVLAGLLTLLLRRERPRSH